MYIDICYALYKGSVNIKATHKLYRYLVYHYSQCQMIAYIVKLLWDHRGYNLKQIKWNIQEELINYAWALESLNWGLTRRKLASPNVHGTETKAFIWGPNASPPENFWCLH